VGGAKPLKPNHLSRFVLERNSGHPIARMPFYADVGVTSFSPLPKPECKLKGAILIGLREFYSSTYGYGRGGYTGETRKAPDPIVELLCDGLSRLLAQETIDRMDVDPAYAAPIISGKPSA
jgi:hypothetical protein